MTSSYFESLGRQQAEPFTDSKLNYERTEPDLVKAINARIDENIKDRQQFYSDQIALFNKTEQAKASRLKDLTQLTKSGKQLYDAAQRFRANSDIFSQIYADSKNNDIVAEYARIDALENEADNELNNIENENLGSLDKDNKDLNNEVWSPQEIIQFRQYLVNAKLTNPKNAIKSLDLLYKLYLPIAKESLVVNGKLWSDTPLEEQEIWLREATALFLDEIIDGTSLTKRHLINHFIPIYETQKKQLIGQSENIYDEVSRDDLSRADDEKTWAYLNNAGQLFKNDETVGVSNVFGKHGWIDNRASYLRARGFQGDIMAQANDDWVEMIKRGIDAGVINEDTINFLLEHERFTPKQHENTEGGQVNYSELKPEHANEIRRYYNAKMKEMSIEAQRDRVDFYLDLLKNNQEIPADWRTTIWDADLVKTMEAAIQVQVENVFRQVAVPEDTLSTMDELITKHILDPDGIYAANINQFGFVEQKRDEIRLLMGEDFIKEYNKYINLGDADVAIEKGLELIYKNLENGVYDKNPNLATLEINEGAANAVIASQAFIEKNGTDAYLNSKEVHENELFWLEEGIKYLTGEIDEMPGYWLALAKEYPSMSSAKLLHERLLATGMLDKPYERLASDIRTLIDAPEIADLLTDNPTITNTVIAFNKTNDKQLNTLLGELVSDNARANGEGNAIKIDGAYAENGDLSALGEEYEGKTLNDLTVREVFTLLKDDRVTNIGLYGFSREELLGVLTEFSSELPLDSTFDTQNQTLAVLYLMYKKAQESKSLANANYTYNRLVHVAKEDLDELLTIIEGIDPRYLAPNNQCNVLNAEACKWLVNYIMPEETED